YEVANVSQIPYYPFVFVVVFGCIATALVCLSNLLRAVKDNFIFQERPIASVLLAFIASTSILAFPFLLKQSEVEMGSITVSLVFIALMILLLILGFPVAFSMALVGVMGIWYLTEFQLSIDIVKMVTYDAVAHYYYCVIPFFILMGFLSLEAGIGTRLYNVGAKWFGQLPGGLAIGTIIGCGGFAAICGDSMATAATMGSVSVPEMNKFNYKASLSNGSVAAGGTLGILIPPSVGFIAYGIVTEQAVGKLFMAGIIPGIILMVCFALMIYSRALLDPELGPRAPKSTLLEKITSIKDIWQVMILFGGVIGGIFSGVITPTEAGAVGAVGALVIAMFSGVFSKEGFYRALLISTKMSGMIFAILIGVGLLGYFVTLTDLPMQLAENLKSIDVSKYVLLTLILMLYLFLGMLMNIIPMIMLTLPILFPTVMALGFDPIWFGVIMVIIMEMGQITPPVGINVFVIHGISGNVPMVEIYKGIVPFVLVQIAVIVLLTLFPEIVMLLPNSMDVLAPIN
ncbi:MAG: TRAP transporter large permease, partial [Deltaproteobacteria bacterium]|nr:TRAP transporter large permease [Deltaproteobacteria bacterium]